MYYMNVGWIKYAMAMVLQGGYAPLRFLDLGLKLQ